MAGISWDMTSYNTVRSAILARAAQGLGYDFDGYYGYQCWDLGANMYWNAGRGTFRTKNSFTGAGGDDSSVYTTWTYQPAFEYNSADPFTAVTNVNEIKRGDMVIWDSRLGGGTGHNAFADEDYDNGKSTISVLGQNQVNANSTTGHIPTINNFNKAGILGAFRYKPWIDGPGPEPPTPPGPEPTGGILHPNGKIVPLWAALRARGRI